ncbi:MAG: ShlB/FhaC/HecB family hemolysin secretion/activation protein [Rhizobacter sp.]
MTELNHREKAHQGPLATAWLMCMACLLPLAAGAQTVPDAGSLLRENQREPAQLPTKAVPIIPPAPAASAASASGNSAAGGIAFTVTAFRIQGAKLVPEAALQAALAPWLNRELRFGDLEQALQAVSETYRSQGWLARPMLPAQDVVGGTVTLVVIESRLGEVRIDDGGVPLRFSRQRLTQTLTARQQAGQALRPDDLERAVTLLNDTPGLRVTAVLAAGQLPGETDLVIKPRDQPRWEGSVQLDNESARATGSSRLSGTASLANPSGEGDQVLFGAHTTGSGNAYLSLAYSVPLGSDGWRAGANVSALSYRLGHEFASLGASGSAQTLGANARYPLLRGSQQSVSFTLAADRRRFVNDANGAEVSDKRLTSFSASLSGDLSDGWQGSGVTLWGINLSSGRVDLSANAASLAADQAGPRTAGVFTRLNWNLSRLQGLDQRSSLWLSGSGQVARNNLDSAEKFGLGGADGVRAYPSLEGSGDSGWLATAEWRYSMQRDLQWVAFYDHGEVRVDHDDSYAGAPAIGHVALKGAGVGLNWSGFGRYTVRARVAQRIGSNPLASPLTGNDSDGSLQRTRVWLALIAVF